MPLGTNEHQPELQIFGYIGQLALKLLFESEIEVFRSRFLVIGSGEFAEQVLMSVRAAGAQAMPMNPRDANTQFAVALQRALPEADAVIIVEHHDRRMLIGDDDEIKPTELHQLAS